MTTRVEFGKRKLRSIARILHLRLIHQVSGSFLQAIHVFNGIMRLPDRVNNSRRPYSHFVSSPLLKKTTPVPEGERGGLERIDEVPSESTLCRR